MTKKLVGLFASVALLGSGMALADDKTKGQQGAQQQVGGDAYGGSGTAQGQTGGQMHGQTAGTQVGEKQIVGTVVRSSADELKLRTESGIIQLKVNRDTQFQDPNVKRVRDLKEGQQVRASFTIQKEDNVARSISLDTSMGGSGLMDSDTGINQPGGTGQDQGGSGGVDNFGRGDNKGGRSQ